MSVMLTPVCRGEGKFAGTTGAEDARIGVQEREDESSCVIVCSARLGCSCVAALHSYVSPVAKVSQQPPDATQPITQCPRNPRLLLFVLLVVLAG